MFVQRVFEHLIAGDAGHALVADNQIQAFAVDDFHGVGARVGAENPIAFAKRALQAVNDIRFVVYEK